MWRVLGLIFQREWRITFSQGVEIFFPLLFFVVVVSIFPLGTSADPKLLRLWGPGIIWVAALLASLLSLNRLFEDDFNDGSLEQMMLSAYPLSGLLLLKIIAHWLKYSLPLIIVTPLLALIQQVWLRQSCHWVALGKNLN